MSDKQQKIAVIGYGMWGKNIVRNFYNLNVLDTVCDLDEETREKIKSLYPSINVISDMNEIANNPAITSVAVVTPSHTHYGIVKKMLEAGKNVYVEKPISTVAQEAKDLMDLANEKGLVLMVGHLLLYHPAVNRLKMLVESGELGEVVYAQSDRLNVNYFKNDRSVMWDLAPHDVSMISYVTGKNPVKVLSAVGCSTERNVVKDITHICIEFEDGVIGYISDSWITPQKHVTLLVRGTKATAILDDTVQENKLKLYDNFSEGKTQDIPLDYLEIEPLKLECQHFIRCCEQGRHARSDGENGYNVTKILEEAEKVMLGGDLAKLNEKSFALSRTKQG